MKISIIAAVSQNLVIGKDNDLAWHLPDDMKYFMKTTQHHHVVMGRKNYESIPHKYRPLPNRTNLVVTRKTVYNAPGCLIFHSIQEALDYSKGENQKEVFIIGGGQIYAAAINLSDTLYITEVHADVKGDTYFPEINADDWQETSRIYHPADDKHQYAFDFVIYNRK